MKKRILFIAVTLFAVLVPFVCVAGRALGYVIKCLKKRR